MVDARAMLDEADARRFLDWPVDACLPNADALLADLRRVVGTNHTLWRRQSKLGQAGLLVSPIWERDGGALAARMAVLPRGFVARYFEAGGAEALADDDLLELVVELMPALADDPVGAAFALGDVHRVWYDDSAPRRALVDVDGPHLRFASMLLADLARKLDAGLDELEWMSSLGLPLAELVDDLDRDPVEVARTARAKTEAMWAEEAAWVRAAFGLEGRGAPR